MSVGVHEAWARSLRFSWMGRKGQAIFGALAKVLGDFSLADAKAAVLEHMPQFAGADSNGLTANDRQLIRGPSETDAGFAARLVAAPTQWRLGGAPLGLLVQLHYANFPGAVVVQQNGLAHSLSSPPDLDDLAAALAARSSPSWYVQTLLPNSNPLIPASPDGKPGISALTVPWFMFDAGMDVAGNQFCSRFGLLFPAGLPGAETLADPPTLARIRRVIAGWKPAKATCAGIWVVTAGRMVGWPIRLVDDGGTVGPATVTFYAGA